MTSVKAQKLYLLQFLDRTGKRDNFFPFLCTNAVDWIEFVGPIQVHLLDVVLERFPGVGLNILNLRMQLELLPPVRLVLKLEAIAGGIASYRIALQFRIGCSSALIEQGLKQ